MSTQFSTYEIFRTAFLLNPKLFLERPKDALRAARNSLRACDLMIEAISNEEHSEFEDSFEVNFTQEEVELAKAKKGEPTEKFIRMDKASGGNSELHKVLEECGANKKLLERQYNWHLERLKIFQRGLPNEERFDFHSPDGAPTDDPFRDAIIIRKESAIKYVEDQIKRTKEEAKIAQRKRRVSK